MDLILVGVAIPGVENLSLAALRRAARAAGFDARVVSFGGWSDLGRALGEIERLRPRVVGLSLQTNQMALPSLSLTLLLRQRGFAGKIVCGGHFATLNAREILDSPAGVDGVVRFAGEEALVGVLRGEDWSTLPGMIHHDFEGAPARLNSPAILDGAVRDRLPEHLGFPAADLVLSRGCEARCAYCCVAGASDLAAQVGERYTRRSVEQIADEIARLFHEGVRVFNFMDDNVLPVDSREAARFVDELGREFRRRAVGRIAFSMQLRADAVSEPVLDGLVELGCVRAYVGVDALSREQLRSLGRRNRQDGALALDQLSERGVFAVCNALILGPTFAFADVLREITALERIRRAPVHLYPVDVRAGTQQLAEVERRGLVEGNFLWRRYRFEDPRTALLAEVLAAMPTRLAERSVAIGLYDLAYNLGIARRLVPDADVSAATASWSRVAARWNADQLRLLRAAAEPASRLEREGVRRLIEEESPRVRAHDQALLDECDAALISVERAVSRAHQRPARAHVRGRLLSALAASMTMAACNRDVLWSDKPDLYSADLLQSIDLSPPLPDGCEPGLDECEIWGACHDMTTIQLTFDGSGSVTSVQATSGTLPQSVADCYQAFFAQHCYPSLASSTQTIFPHCFIA